MIDRGFAMMGAVASVGSPVLQERIYGWGWSMHPMGWMLGVGGLVMMLTMLVFWGLVIWGLVVGIRWLMGQGRPERPDGALEILRERYARGEMGQEEFEARRRALAEDRLRK